MESFIEFNNIKTAQVKTTSKFLISKSNDKIKRRIVHSQAGSK